MKNFLPGFEKNECKSYFLIIFQFQDKENIIDI